MKYKTSVAGADVRSTTDDNIVYDASNKTVFKTILNGQFDYTFPSSLTAGTYTLGTVNHNLGYLPAVIFSTAIDTTGNPSSIKTLYLQNGTLGLDLCVYIFKLSITSTQISFMLEIWGDGGSDYIDLSGRKVSYKYYVVADPLQV